MRLRWRALNKLIKISICFICSSLFLLYAINLRTHRTSVNDHFGDLNNDKRSRHETIIISDSQSSQLSQCLTQTVINFLRSPIVIKLNIFVIEPIILTQLLTSNEAKILLNHNLLANTSNCEHSLILGIVDDGHEVSLPLPRIFDVRRS